VTPVLPAIRCVPRAVTIRSTAAVACLATAACATASPTARRSTSPIMIERSSWLRPITRSASSSGSVVGPWTRGRKPCRMPRPAATIPSQRAVTRREMPSVDGDSRAGWRSDDPERDGQGDREGAQLSANSRRASPSWSEAEIRLQVRDPARACSSAPGARSAEPRSRIVDARDLLVFARRGSFSSAFDSAPRRIPCVSLRQLGLLGHPLGKLSPACDPVAVRRRQRLIRALAIRRHLPVEPGREHQVRQVDQDPPGRTPMTARRTARRSFDGARLWRVRASPPQPSRASRTPASDTPRRRCRCGIRIPDLDRVDLEGPDQSRRRASTRVKS
jgi:hypothetical protein